MQFLGFCAFSENKRKYEKPNLRNGIFKNQITNKLRSPKHAVWKIRRVCMTMYFRGIHLSHFTAIRARNFDKLLSQSLAISNNRAIINLLPRTYDSARLLFILAHKFLAQTTIKLTLIIKPYNVVWKKKKRKKKRYSYEILENWCIKGRASTSNETVGQWLFSGF